MRSTPAPTSTRGIPPPTSTRGVPAPRTSSGLGSLIRHGSIVIESTEYGRVAKDMTEVNDQAYLDARSKDLLYLEDSGKRYPDHHSLGWLDIHNIPKKSVPDSYPADTDEAGLSAHITTIPPRYSEGDKDMVIVNHRLSGSLGTTR